MLYDNAQLLKLYSMGYQLTKSTEFKTIVQNTADYIRREMTSPEGWARGDDGEKNKKGVLRYCPGGFLKDKRLGLIK